MESKLKFIPTSNWYDEYDRVQYMHITCLLYKLGVIEEPVMMGRASRLLRRWQKTCSLDIYTYMREILNEDVCRAVAGICERE
jgi:hypothetical protein